MAAAAFLRLINHPLRFRLFLWKNLPAAFFSGLRIQTITEDACSVSIRYKWFTRNPFRSTYFACLNMAAELSTGTLAMAHIYGRKPAVSMLVIKIETDFIKRATGLTVFTCPDGGLVREAIDAAVQSGEPRTVRVTSTGRNEKGEEVAVSYITWSFKRK